MSQEQQNERPKEPLPPFRAGLLDGKAAVVTGGNDGIGAAVTKSLVQAGARVAVVARNKDKFDKLAAELGSGAQVSFFQADLSNASQTAEAASAAVAWAGNAVDILVNNAGVALLDPLDSLSVEKWDQTMAVNVRAPFLMAQACVKGMIAKGAGKIINISSQAGTVALADHAAYCASKAALDSLTRVMTVEWAKHNIQCNSIGPTVIMTEMGQRAWGDPAKSGPMLQKTPLGRFGEPWEVANFVCYLCSDASNIICGQTLLMEGGFTIA